MKIDRFENLIVWQKASDFVALIYQLFGTSRDYGFRDQILRAVLSIMNNIAEGFERKGDREFKHFLFIAKGSCGEVRSMLHIALRLRFITKAQFDTASACALEISRMLSGFIKTLD